MPRITLTPAPHYPFATEIQIYISHVNQGGHLDNAQLLTLVSEARVRFFHALGYLESAVEGVLIVVGGIVAQYQSDGFHGETVTVRASCCESLAASVNRSTARPSLSGVKNSPFASPVIVSKKWRVCSMYIWLAS